MRNVDRLACGPQSVQATRSGQARSTQGVVFKMVPAMHDKIGTYTSNMAEEHHRYRSWEHCFDYFHQNSIEVIARDRDRAALELGFYLASWGMYRGSGFLLQHNYTIHRGAIDVFVSPQFAELRSREFGARDSDSHLSE